MQSRSGTKHRDSRSHGLTQSTLAESGHGLQSNGGGRGLTWLGEGRQHTSVARREEEFSAIPVITKGMMDGARRVTCRAGGIPGLEVETG